MYGCYDILVYRYTDCPKRYICFRQSLNLKILIPLLLLLFAVGATAESQNLPPSWTTFVEQWQEAQGDDGTDGVEEWTEIYESLAEWPVNLNDTLDDRLSSLPFVGQERGRLLKAYIEQNGPLMSVDELYVVNGFERELVDMLRSIVVAQPVVPPDTLTLRTILTHGRSNLLVGAGGNIEPARGYREGQYEGDPYRLYMRYQYRYRDRVHLSLSADKDAGEVLFGGSQPQGFDFYSGFLMMNNIGIVSRAIVGHYNLQFGQGLTLWSGFAPYGAVIGDDIRAARGICPASAFAEQGYMQGAAAAVQLPLSFSLSAFYSNVARDATIDQGLLRSISNSGYHRTATELSHKDALREQVFGTHLQYRRENLEIGATLCRTLLSDTLVPRPYVYNYNAFAGIDNTNLGIDFRYRHRNLSLYGEAALSSLGGWAAIAGVRLSLSSEQSIGLSARHYSADYHNLHSAPLAITSGPGNEQGLRLSYRTVLPLGIRALAETDAYRLPAIRYGIYAPSSGTRYRLLLSRQMNRHTLLALSYNHRHSERNSTLDDVAEYIVEPATRRYLTANLTYERGSLRLRTQASRCWYSSQWHGRQQGFLLYQDAQYSLTRLPLVLAMRLLLFDADSYDARLYAVEHDVAYQLSSPAFSGQGMRFYLVARYSPIASLTISAKYAITIYSDAETIGTGYEQTEGDHRQQWKLQLRWKF